MAISTIGTNALSSTAQIGSLTTASGSAPSYSARAWVFFVVSGGTPTIQASGNISSITDNGVGDYTFNFTSSLPDANYSFDGIGTGGGANYQIAGGNILGGTVRSTSSLRTPFGYVSSVGGGLSAQDPVSASVNIFR